ncbi:MAG: threonine ammonia-lyase [Pyrinomonadaceae bacterium]|nr:threonine ammonia-lyase [Pyrinomonadaceae bacterium]
MSLSYQDIEAAAGRLTGVAAKTPIITDNRLSAKLDADIHFKAECLQRSGSFKIRGAYNKISQLSDEEKRRGVIAASAGNHAQGVALAARLNGIESTIVLPEFAPLTKINATREFGARVVLHGSSFDEAVDHSRELQKEHGFTYVHAFEDEQIIAGQGTIGMEIAEFLADVTKVIVPIGGGGVIAGTALAIKHLVPDVRVIGVEASNIAVINRSIDAGEPVEVPFKPTIADGIAIKRPGSIPLKIIEENVDEVVEVTEEEIATGIYHCVQNNHLVVEGAGAAGAAALLAGKIDVAQGDVVCAVLCGGNIDANLLARVLEHVLVRQGRYLIVKALVDDRPGKLSALLDRVAKKGASVMEVYHRRAMYLAPLGSVGIELLLEVRNEEHGVEILEYLEESGYDVTRKVVDEW